MTKALDRLEKNVVHEICTNQVVVTLQACVKELVENALDAGATRIEVRLRENGSELLEVVDNGRGIAAEDFEKLATRHATSKIRDYGDLNTSLNTFGFRGEALAGICAMGDVRVCTKQDGSASATQLSYDRFGKLTEQSQSAREVGTTVSVRDLFKRLPVRHREFVRNAKAQVGATLRLMQAYAIAEPTIRFQVSSEKAKGQGSGKSLLMSTSGSARGWRDASAAVLGDVVMQDVVQLETQADGGSNTGWSVSGLISTPNGGRRSRDTQLFFVNRRPVDPPKRVVKLINDTYHQYNSRMWPVVILSFTAASNLVDVNVTPDKRTVFMHGEETLLEELQKRLTAIYAPSGEPGKEGLALSSFGIKPSSSGSAGRTPAAAVTATPMSDSPPLSALQDVEDAQTPENAQKQKLGEADRACGITAAFGSSAKHLAEPSYDTPPRPVGTAGRQPEMAVLKGTRTEPLESEVPGLQVLELTMHGADESEVMTDVMDAAQTDDALQAGSASASVSVTELVLEMPGQGDSAAAQPMEEDAALVLHSIDLDGSCRQDDEMDVEDWSDEEPIQLPPLLPPLAVSATLGGMEAALQRKRQRRSSTSASVDGRGKAPGVAFPKAFSLKSLQGTAGGDKESLEAVAKFATGPSVDDESSNALGDSDQALTFNKEHFSQMRVIGQFNLGFIIASLRTSPPGSGSQTGSPTPAGMQLFIVDQHASDEKYRFENLNRESKVDKQPLVSPFTLQLTPAQEQLAGAHLEVFGLNGFNLNYKDERPAGKRVQVTALPTCKGMVFGEKDVHDLLFNLEEAETQRVAPSLQDASAAAAEKTGGLLDLRSHRGLWSATAVPRPKKVWQLLACRACRGAIMIGKALRVAEMERVLQNLGSLQQPWNCPHGRPTMRHLIDAGDAWQRPQRGTPLTKLMLEAA
eukprot:TRINITY_DN11818_c0_g1_i1.p1 TRINITY_DN11818_c0_g1~~TRINITY_DN11818_c0_g1_i1.p1  ORF type:complete len:918 (-),score=210.40 TRINITY_DN11818_c0_g1_i1:135-2888(-)